LISTDPQPQTVSLNGCDSDHPDVATANVQRPLADIESGRIVSNDRQTIYVSGSHWASISYEVSRSHGMRGPTLPLFYSLTVM
jgi:hypothetical protein